MLHVWTIVCLFTANACLSFAQTSCQQKACQNDTYCNDASGTALCIQCDTACSSCDGPGPERCIQCQIGYSRPQGVAQPCLVCNFGLFGVNCTSTCHCLENEFCNKADGNCTRWKCDRGYTGLPQCQDLCPVGTFGIDCLKECHCPTNDNCSIVNGDCSSGRCHPDWGSGGCQRRLPKLTMPPRLIDARCNNITLVWNAFNETLDIGKGPVGQYRLYKTANGNDTGWQLLSNIPVVSGKFQYPYSVTTDLVPEFMYTFRVDAVGEDFGKLMSQVSIGIASDAMLYTCAATAAPGTDNTTMNIISRKVFDQINITAVNSSLVRIAWSVLPEVRMYQYNVMLTRQLLGNGDCDTVGGPVQVCGPLKISDFPVAFSELQSWSTYRINVSGIAVSADVKETFTQNVTTLPAVPVGVITSLKSDWLTSTEAELSWGPVPCSQRKGPLSSYEVVITALNSPSTEQLKYIAQNARIGLANLTSNTQYSIQIRYTNPAGQGPLSQSLNFTTLDGVPGPTQITQLTPSISTVTVSFQSPAQPNGVLTSYTVTYKDCSNVDVYKSVTVPAVEAANQNFSTILIQLTPNTDYCFKIAASTSRGIGQYGTEKQTRTLPPDVMSVYILSRTNSCLTIGWSPPANITSCVLEVKKASADTTTQPIRVDIPVSQHSYQVCQLRSSTLYIVTLSWTNSSGAITSLTENFSTVHGTPPTPVAPIFVRSSNSSITIVIEPVISPDVIITAYQIQVVQDPVSGRKKRWAEISGYVTAQLPPTDVTQRREFIVGDGMPYGGYDNKALQQDSLYMIYYVAMSSLNGDTTASWAQLRTTIRTVPFDSTLSPPVLISLGSYNTTCLSLTWDLPQGVENVLTGITLTVRRISDNVTVRSEDLPVATRIYQECSLAPFTVYTVGVTARASDGRMTIASETFTTDFNTPRTPAAPVFVSSSYTSITIAIEPVVLTDAPLTAYQLQVEAVTSGRRKRIAAVPGYVTAQLTKDDVTQKINFIIGDGKNYGDFVNTALDRDTLYRVHYVVISNVSSITKYSYSSLNPPVRTEPYVAPTTQPDSDNTHVLIGVIVALVLFVLLVLLLILLYWCWRKKNRFNPYLVQEDDKSAVTLSELDNYDPEKYWSASYDLHNSRHIIAGRDLINKGRQFPSGNEEEIPNSALPKVSFYDEFHNLPHKSRKATDNLARQNSELNRFPHLLPYDHSLVKLKPDDSSQRTYINASFIPGYKKTPAYIAVQSPYDEETVLDFWRLIYQKSIKTVVMITNVVEDSIVKCTQYWPDDTKASYGNFLLHLTEVTVYADYIVRTVEIRCSGEEQSKTVKLFEFTSWPDHGVPDDPIPFLEMRHNVRCHHQDEGGPILVHCGTGMGRSGVFIAMDALVEQYAAEGRVMVFDFVRRIRKDRPFMVRTLKQYVFIYEALFEQFLAGDTLVDFGLKDKYHNWTRKNPRTGRTYLRDQFQLLETFTRGPRNDELKTALVEVNVNKNRYLDVIPPEKHRPMLRSLGGPNSTDYINALFLDGYLKKNQFIITQTPLHTTIVDFWKLVYDYEVRTIVMVENFKNEDDTCVEYWSNANPKQFEPFIIETTVAYQHDNITIRSFRVSSKQHPKEPPKVVMQFQFNAWAHPNLTPQSKTMMMDLIEDVFVWQEKVCQNKKPVIVHCQDGSSHSGLFAVLAILFEKMKKDKSVDIYKTIKHCKRRRTQFIADYDQLRFCYKAVWDYINLRMPGGLFTEALGQNKNDQHYGVASLNLTSYFDKFTSDEQHAYI